MKARVAGLRTDGAQTAATGAAWRAWYGTKRWRQLRWQVLLEAMFTCARCGRIEGNTRLLVADHVEPHRGDERMFWARGNLQCLCKPCHDSEKQREEAAARR
jgi:5-methylcytosine-specific restriction enzyme A